jgi:flagellar basal body P-ring formation protein FlgA
LVRALFAALALTLLLPAAGGAAVGKIGVDLSKKAAVVGPQITLGEIADVTGSNSAVVDRVRGLQLGRAAPAGLEVKVVLGYVKIALRREGYSLGDFTFTGANASVVKTQSRVFDPAGLLPQIKSFIVRQTREPPENVEVRMEGAPQTLLLPAGDLKADFRPSFSGLYQGTVFLTAELSVDGHFIKPLPLRVQVDIVHPAVVAVRRIEKGEEFTAGNIAVEKVSASKITRGCFAKLEYVAGRRAADLVLPQTVIQVSDIYDPPVIRHGQIVQAVVEKGNVELSVEARAIEDGKAGDMIQVENTASHKILKGKVLDENTVLVQIDGDP